MNPSQQGHFRAATPAARTQPEAAVLLCRNAGASASPAVEPGRAAPAALPKVIMASVVKHAPLVGIDLVVVNEKKDILLELRRDAPARGYWCVPSGRVCKDESLASALGRLLQGKLGLDQAYPTSLIGVFEQFYDDNFTSTTAFGTHQIVLAYRVSLTRMMSPRIPRRPSVGYRWMPAAQMAHAQHDVHAYSRIYTELS